VRMNSVTRRDNSLFFHFTVGLILEASLLSSVNMADAGENKNIYTVFSQ
jgi:hypothetical protein